MSTAHTIAYRRDIDGLRALAVLLVLIFHFQLAPVGEGGFLGVDVFFVISGYLITSILLKQLNDSTFRFKRFYAKRILRLAPVLFAVLTLTLIAGAFIYLPSDFTELANQVLATQLYFSNVYFWQHINYFGLHADSVPLLHTWSLAVEEQFYLVFPAFIYLIHRFARAYFWPLIAASTLVSFLLNIVLVTSKPELTFYLVPTRGWEFLLGSLAVWLSTRTRLLTRTNCEILGILGTLLVFAGVFLYAKDTVFPGYYALFPSVGAALMILSGTQPRTGIAKLLASPIPVYIGKLSYSLYLAHWPIHIFATELLGDGYSLPWRLAMLGVTFLVAWILLKWVEEPTRSGRFLNSDGKVFSGYFAGLVLSVAVCVLVVLTRGLPSRFDASALAMASFTDDRPPPMTECRFADKPLTNAADFCVLGNAKASPRWLVFGDSHAWAAKESFGLWLEGKGEGGLFIFLHACPPLVGIDIFGSKGTCTRFNENVFSFIEASPNLNEIVLVSTWIYPKEGQLTTRSDLLLSVKESEQLFTQSLTKTLDRLTQAGKNIYVWAPVPGAKADVPKTLAKARDIPSAADDLAYTLDEYHQHHRYFFSALPANSSKIRRLFSPADALCGTSHKCEVLIDGKPVYFDNSHLARNHNQFWADVLKTQEQGR